MAKTYAFLDFDVGGHRARFSRGAAFVDATDTRYSWSSKDVRELGGSELQRVPDMFAVDHDWATRGPIAVRPPGCGCRVVVELYTSVAPLAYENFLRLCRGAEPASAGDCGVPLAYR